MDCCQCKGIESQFDQDEAERKLREYRKHGPAKSTRILVDALVAEGIAGQTLLDIGGGVGSIQHALLAAGATHATGVDASGAYLATARAEAGRRGYADRATFRHGNFVDMAADTAPADIVTLDRVICCYHDMPALVGASAALARRQYGVVLPRDGWWMRAGVGLENAMFWLQGTSFRVFAHRRADVDAVALQHGFAPRFARNVGVWQVVVYSRRAAREMI